MGPLGGARDGAMAEGSFGSLGAELPARRRFASQAGAKMARFGRAEGSRDPARPHPALGRRSPVAHEEERMRAVEMQP